MDSKIRDALIEIMDNGGEEFESVSSVKKDFHVVITEEEGPAFRDNQRAIFIKEPYDYKRYEQILEFFGFSCDSQIAKSNIIIIEERGEKYIKYPLSVAQSEISDNIWSELLNEHGIDPEDYNDEEHEALVKSQEWKKCEKQVLRDLLGIQLLDKLSKVKN